VPKDLTREYFSIFNHIEKTTGDTSKKQKDKRHLKSVGYKAKLVSRKNVDNNINSILRSPSYLFGDSVSGFHQTTPEIKYEESKENLDEYKNKVLKGLEELKQKLAENSQGGGIQHIDDLMKQLVEKNDTLDLEESVFQVLKKIETPRLTPFKSKPENRAFQNVVANDLKIEADLKKKEILGKRSSILCFFEKAGKNERPKIESPKPKKQRIDQMIMKMKTTSPLKVKNPNHLQTRMDRFLVERRSNTKVKICNLSKLIWIQIMPYLHLRDMARLSCTCRFFKDIYRLLFFRMGSFLNIFDSEAHSEREIQELYQKSRSHSHRILKQFFMGKNSKSVLARTKLKVGFSHINKNGHSFNKLSVGPKGQSRRVNTTFLTDSDLAQVISVSRYSLMDLSLDVCLMLSHAGFKSINKLKNLISFRINMNANFRDENVRDILENCSFLRKLEVINCSRLTEITLQHITSFGTKINYLDLSGNKAIFDEFDGFGFFSRISRLKYLVLMSIDLTNAQIMSLIENCSKLIVLNCQGNRRVNKELIEMTKKLERKERLVIIVKSTRIPQHEIIIDPK
jgi:hypothetical protein